MRLHVHLDDDLVRELDAVVGARERSRFIQDAVRKELESRRRWDLIWSAVGSVEDSGHAWDPDPAAWVREQRREQAEHSDARVRPAGDQT